MGSLKPSLPGDRPSGMTATSGDDARGQDVLISIMSIIDIAYHAIQM